MYECPHAAHTSDSRSTMRTWSLDRSRFLTHFRSALVGYRKGDLLERDVPACLLHCRVIKSVKQPETASKWDR